MFNKKQVLLSFCLLALPISPTFAASNTMAQRPVVVNFANTENQQNFINSLKPEAMQLSDQYGIWTSIILAQAIIESNWGTSQLSKAPNYNLFGIKANNDWNKRTVTLPTQEWDKNSKQYVTINARFRAYDNYGQSMTDNAQKLRYGLSWDPNYYQGTWLENTVSYEDSARWLQGRYATSPTYANTLIKAIKNYNLNQYDPKVETVNSPAKISYVEGYSIKVYDSPAGVRKETGKLLKTGTKVQVTKKVTLHDGTAYYQIGYKEWIPAIYTNVQNQISWTAGRGIVRVKYVPGYSIAVWKVPGPNRIFTGLKLKHGTDWKYSAKYYINGQVWYRVGKDQWIDGTYATQLS